MLQPGLELEEIKEHLQSIQIWPTKSLCELYCWRNGLGRSEQASLGELYFFPWCYLETLAESVATYRMFLRNEAKAWDRAYFPVFGDGGGDYYAIKCDKRPTDDGEIIWTMREDLDYPVVYQSLLAMLRTLEACFSRHVYSVDESGLKADLEREKEIGRIFNPSLPYWNVGRG